MCGGRSIRWGSDKGLNTIRNTSWAAFMAEKLSFLKVPVVFSINEHQFKNYCDQIVPDFLIVDDNDLQGPARGLLTLHRKFPSFDILLLACDMLELDERTIRNLFEQYAQDNSYDFYVYQDATYAQPFCGIYTAAGIDKLRTDLASRLLTNISMQYIIDKGHTKRIPIINNEAFSNFNSRF